MTTGHIIHHDTPQALIEAFERQYDTSWDDPTARKERMAMRYGWNAAMQAKQCLLQIQEPTAKPETMGSKYRVRWKGKDGDWLDWTSLGGGVKFSDIEVEPIKTAAPLAVGDELDKAVARMNEHLPVRVTPAGKFTTPLFTAPQAQADARDAETLLSSGDLDDLRRFEGMASDGEGYDIAKKRMKRLAELGVVRWVGGSRYCMTAFGHYVLNDWTHLPLETHEEANARVNAEFKARIDRLNAEAIAAQAAQQGGKRHE